MAHDVFISYSTKDKVTADAICHTLEENQMKCWIAPRNIASGKPYAEEIMNAIQQTKIVVLVFSSNSQASQFVNNEINIAFTNSKPILSFKIDESMPEKEMAFYLKTNHWLEAYPNPEREFATLVKDASMLVGIENKNPIVDSDVMERARKGEFNNFYSKYDWIYYLLLLTPLYPIVTMRMGSASNIRQMRKMGKICLIPLILYLLFSFFGVFEIFTIQRAALMVFMLILLVINFIYALIMKDEFRIRKAVLNVVSDEDELFDDLVEEYTRV